MLARRVVALLSILVTVLCFSACTPAPLGGIDAAGLSRLRKCESGGDYHAVSASGTYRGAYQFDHGTWNSVASRHWPPAVHEDPATASVETQDALARWLWAERGRGPWPLCGRRV